MGITVMVILIGLSYLNCRHTSTLGPVYPQAPGLVIVQALATAVAIPALAPQALPAPYYCQQQK
jgi:hypothetical protein